jgi:hypothetical protein
VGRFGLLIRTGAAAPAGAGTADPSDSKLVRGTEVSPAKPTEENLN